MKALTVLQPMASLLADGHKHLETRSYYLEPGTEFAIHAAKNDRLKQFYTVFGYSMEPPRGVVIAKAKVKEVWKVENGFLKNIRDGWLIDKCDVATDIDLVTCEFIEGWYAMELEITPIEPVPARGQQGIWEWNEGGKV